MGLRSTLSQYLTKLAEKAGVTEDDMIKDIQKGIKDPKDLPDEVVKRYNQMFSGAAPESEGAKTLRETIQASQPEQPKQLTAGVPATTSQERGLVPTAERASKAGAMENKPLMLEGEVLGEPSPKMSGAPQQSTVPMEQRPLTAEDLREPDSSSMSLRKKIGLGTAGLGVAGAAVNGFSSKEQAPPSQPSQAPEASKPQEEVLPSKASKGKINSGNKQIDTLVNSSSKIKNPDDITELRNQAEELADKLSPMSRKLYESKLAQLEQERKDANDIYKQNANRTEWMEVAEKIGHAFAQLGAAAHGLATGVDLSGLKFDKTDWSKKFDRLMGELDATKKDIGSREKLASEGKSDRDKMAESLFDQLVKGKLSKEEQAFKSKERLQDEAFKASESAKDRASREKIAGERNETTLAKDGGKAAKANQQQLGALNELETSLSNLGSLKTKDKAKAVQDLRKTFSKLPDFDVSTYDSAMKDYNSSFFEDSKKKALAPLKQAISDYRSKLQGGQGGAEGGTILMKNPKTGQTVKVPADKVEQAAKAGYTR